MQGEGIGLGRMETNAPDEGTYARGMRDEKSVTASYAELLSEKELAAEKEAEMDTMDLVSLVAGIGGFFLRVPALGWMALLANLAKLTDLSVKRRDFSNIISSTVFAFTGLASMYLRPGPRLRTA